MTVQAISNIYNGVFIMILILVCMLFSRVHLKVAGRYSSKSWLFTSVYFVTICFITIALWYLTVGFIF